MRKYCKIPDSVIRRIPKYIRYINKCLDEEVHYTTSANIAEAVGISSGTVRNDFNFFGLFGNQGKGYETWKLKAELEKIMGINLRRKAVLIGTEGLGKSIIEHYKFDDIGYRIDAVFRVGNGYTGQSIKGIPVYDIGRMDDYLKTNSVDVFILAVTDEMTRDMSEFVISRGGKAILNCTNTDIVTDSSVFVESLQPVDSMLRLSYFMSQS